MKLGSRDLAKAGFILFLVMVTSVLHFATSTDYRYLHEIYQRVYYIPILLAAYWYGPLWGVATAAFSSAIYSYHIHHDWGHFPHYSFNQYAEIVLYHALALVIGFLAQKDRRRRQELEKATAELAEAYRKLQATYEQLKRADRLAALGQLSAGIAHEIRNPLGSIKGSIEILEGEIAADSPKREFIRIIKEETARLNSIVGEFLKFARPPKPSMAPFSLNELIDSTLVLLQRQAQQSGVEIRTMLDPALPALSLDPDQIRQVLLNVMLNGIQAMPEGGVLEIRSTRNAEDGVLVEISDTGAGVPEPDLDQIFDPFFTTKPGGSGLGLFISHQLVQNHGGRISARRNACAGMTFRIDLPRREGAAGIVGTAGALTASFLV